MLLFDLYVAGTVFYSPLDDWQWSMDTGIWWLETGVLNGRYMGNLFAVVMTRLPWLKTLSMALCMFALPYFMARLAARGRRERVLPLFVACNAGILLMPSVMWRETYFWVSGFGNFVVPTTGALLLLLLLRRLDRVRAHWGAWSALLFVYLLGLGLFLESFGDYLYIHLKLFTVFHSFAPLKVPPASPRRSLLPGQCLLCLMFHNVSRIPPIPVLLWRLPVFLPTSLPQSLPYVPEAQYLPDPGPGSAR